MIKAKPIDSMTEHSGMSSEKSRHSWAGWTTSQCPEPSGSSECGRREAPRRKLQQPRRQSLPRDRSFPEHAGASSTRHAADHEPHRRENWSGSRLSSLRTALKSSFGRHRFRQVRREHTRAEVLEHEQQRRGIAARQERSRRRHDQRTLIAPDSGRQALRRNAFVTKPFLFLLPNKRKRKTGRFSVLPCAKSLRSRFRSDRPKTRKVLR